MKSAIIYWIHAPALPNPWLTGYIGATYKQGNYFDEYWSSSPFMHESYEKYGKDKFIKEIIFQFNVSDISIRNKIENDYMQMYRTHDPRCITGCNQAWSHSIFINKCKYCGKYVEDTNKYHGNNCSSAPLKFV